MAQQKWRSRAASTPLEMSSTRIKDAGIAIHHSRGRILFYTAGSGTGLEWVVALWANKLILRKRHYFVIEKYVEDAKQEKKDVPDLVESIMWPTDPAKAELRRILSKMVNLDPKSSKSGFQLFGCPEKSRIPAGGCLQEQSRLFSTRFHPMTASKTSRN